MLHDKQGMEMGLRGETWGRQNCFPVALLLRAGNDVQPAGFCACHDVFVPAAGAPEQATARGLAHGYYFIHMVVTYRIKPRHVSNGLFADIGTH